jgi:ASCH domain-containing protein
MKALTIWQPWASLIMIGAKPYEFRRWDYRARERGLEGQRIMIHAGARPVKLAEVEDIIDRMADRISSLRAEIAMPLLTRLRDAHKCRGVVELSAALGTAVLGKPKHVAALFNSPADSDRIDHHMWAWPLADIKPFAAPVHCRGAQGFWLYPYGEARAA